MKRLQPITKIADRVILLTISVGLLAIILAITLGVFFAPRALPNWAENVLVSIGTAAGMKLGDCLSTLIALGVPKDRSISTE